MMMKLSILLITLFVLVACGNKPPDAMFCADLTRGQGYCRHMISGESKAMTRDEYAEFTKKAFKIHVNDVEKLIQFFERHCDRNECNEGKKAVLEFNRLKYQLEVLK